jgi:sigma-B regulation protein RsbU (phosphoserine phosphatase)
MNTDQVGSLKEKILERKNRLTSFSQEIAATAEIAKLLDDLDAALLRIENGTYGTCEVCGDPIEPERLEVDPLLTFCLDHLNYQQQRNLENDLMLTSRIQQNLLPSKQLSIPGWEIAYHYEPAGLVSGDYCDIIFNEEKREPYYLVIGDVTGKGVAAGMLMSHLHAMFHTLIPLGLYSDELMIRMNSLLCESSLATQFATLLLATVHENGGLRISNAGHCLPIIFKEGETIQLDSNGLPLGVVNNARYNCNILTLNSGDVLFLYTDGLTEARNGEEMFETHRLLNPKKEYRKMTSRQIIDDTLGELKLFLNGNEKIDDLTIMVLKKI